MKIVADENIPLLAEAFGPLGEVVALPADAITPQTVADADALLVRSVTPVGPDLLDGSRVRFVATATIGIDHVDTAYLERRGIGFASAQGSNARSVAEYVLAALLVLARRRGRRLADLAVGVVGVGNVGGRLARMLEGLGVRVLRNDPPLARRTGEARFLPFETLAREADVLTFHVPLTRTGPDATYHMIDRDLLGRLRPGVWLVNTSRGAVAETEALAEAAERGRGSGGREGLGALVCDVWEGEPAIPARLLAAADLATPHIAGYSYDGKVAGTRMVLEALCRHFGLQRPWDPRPLMPPPRVRRLDLTGPEGRDAAGRLDPEEALGRAVRAAYDIEADDRALRAMLDRPEAERPGYFKRLRREYPVRREFPETTVAVREGDEAAARVLQAVGFPVEVEG